MKPRISALVVCPLLMALTAIVLVVDPVKTSAADLAATRIVAREAEQKLLQSLHKKIKSEWNEVPLTTVLNSIAKEAGIVAWIDEHALTDEGLDRDIKVTLNLTDATVWQTLYFLLTPIGLTWTAPDGVLEVTTKSRADGVMFTRSYDVTSIAKVLEPQLRHRSRKQGTKRLAPMSGGGMGGVQGAPAIIVERNPQPTFILAQIGRAQEALIEEWEPNRDRILGWKTDRFSSTAEAALSEMVKWCNVAKWIDVDQEGGAIVTVRGNLIIRQNYQTHLQIQSLLHAIEGIVVRGVKAKSVDVSRPGYPHDEDAAIIRRLTELKTIDVKDQLLEDVVRSLASSSAIRIWIDIPALSEAGVRKDHPVTLTHVGVPLNVVLKRLLEPLGLETLVREGVLIVTTRDRAESEETIVLYTTADLKGINADDLATAFEGCTEGKWVQNDQVGGAFDQLGPHLFVIRQQQRVHAEIATLLEDLRRSPEAKQDPPSPRLVQRVYPVHDETTLIDLVRSIPDLVPDWDARHGSIHRLGQTIAIKQPEFVHERVGELLGAMNAAYRTMKPKTPAVSAPASIQVPVPAQPPGPPSPPVIPAKDPQK